MNWLVLQIKVLQHIVNINQQYKQKQKQNELKKALDLSTEISSFIAKNVIDLCSYCSVDVIAILICKLYLCEKIHTAFFYVIE